MVIIWVYQGFQPCRNQYIALHHVCPDSMVPTCGFWAALLGVLAKAPPLKEVSKVKGVFPNHLQLDHFGIETYRGTPVLEKKQRLIMCYLPYIIF